ncbi:NADPH2:quinone reductase [Roseiarcus fermentans]|uniref:NADPH2:quinone reductase n=1 Tax=Roseiarcus fermentans TaxID=1473586 RepID=A0A366FI57_9HYPH|nr:NADPH:quinone oxidoreductase family protein [Roseiarcus fermentans]RBP14277.1 NADPH2:quinone reductase [Roseiarcus fermentans]
MKALICPALGPAETLIVTEVERPVAGPGEVVVDIVYAALNFFDTLIIEGKYQLKPEPPFSPAGEFAGRVAEIGAGVTGFAVGDRVMGSTGFGAAREAIAIAANRLAHVPAGLALDKAAGLSIAYGTTLHALKQRAEMKPGESLVVLGASGGVGLAAVEIGKAMGARVIACASSDDKLAFARGYGATETINYATEDFRARLKALTGGKGVDVVYDPVGGPLTELALRSLAWKGRLLVIGFASGEIPKPPLNLTLLKGCDIRGVYWGDFVAREPEANRDNMSQLLSWAESGALQVHVHAIFPIERRLEAFQAISRRQALGKVLLQLGTDV